MQTTDLESSEIFELVDKLVGFLPIAEARVVTSDKLIQSVAMPMGLPDDDSFGSDTKNEGMAEARVSLLLMLCVQTATVQIEKIYCDQSRLGIFTESASFCFLILGLQGFACRAEIHVATQRALVVMRMVLVISLELETCTSKDTDKVGCNNV